MQELSKSQKARIAIRTFKILADSMTLQGSYKPSGRIGEKLAEALKQLSPEIYGSMSDTRVVELHGLESSLPPKRTFRTPRSRKLCP